MAPRSPTHAFDPSPALERDPNHYSPFNNPFPNQDSYDSMDKLTKEVHFGGATNIPMRGRHSIATTTVPLLPTLPSASQIPKQAFRISNPTQGIDINAYFENCRNLNEQLRTAHETERRAWNIERSALKGRIAELEFKLNKSRDPKRRLSNDSSAPNASSFRQEIRFAPKPYMNGVKKSPPTSAPPLTKTTSAPAVPHAPGTAPVWKGPEYTPPVTRVFSNEDDVNHLPSISEDAPMESLSKQVSPHSLVTINSHPVMISEVDKTLDGVTLKSTGLQSSFVTKITSPQFGSPNGVPSPKPVESEQKAGGLSVNMNGLMSPMDEKLKRHAGHTPLIFDGPLSDVTTTGVPTPKAEEPKEPAVTKRPPLRPSENSDSYFSFTSDVQADLNAKKDEWVDEPAQEPEVVHETEEDPALKGPLMLDPTARGLAAESFLSKVDEKLMEAVKAPRKDSVLSDIVEEVATQEAQAVTAPAPDPVEPEKEKDDDMPRLKMKKSTNFGSAWGTNFSGRV